MHQRLSLIISSTLAILLLLSITTKSIAENNQTQNSASDIRALLPKSCIFSSSFQQEKKSQKLPFPLVSSGQIFFHCQKGLIWEKKSPFLEKTIFTTQEANFRLVPNEPIEQLEGPQYDYLSSLLLSLLSADIATINDKFTVDIASENKHIKLTPKSNTIRKRLHSIDIKKNDSVENESLDIYISTQKNQTTKISINNISNLDNINPNNSTDYQPCLSLLETTDSDRDVCDMLKNPQKYTGLNLNNQK